MIAWAGYEMYQAGYISGYDITQRKTWTLDHLMDEESGLVKHGKQVHTT
jgi:tRNA A37 threonylcarbamoyltransferase TsaD